MMQSSVAQRLNAIKWSDLHTVLIVFRASSIKKASADLKTTESTVSRRVSAVESILGFDVFERTPLGMFPTTPGTQLLRYLERAEAEVEHGLEAASIQENIPNGLVRITSVPVLMSRVIIPASKAFLEKFPEIELETIAAPADLSMSRREADIAVRLARPSSDHSAVTKKLGILDYSVFASAAFNSEEVKALPWLTYDRKMSSLPQARWVASWAQMTGEPLSPLRCNDAEQLLMAVQGGSGKAVLPTIIARHNPQLKRLGIYSDVPSREMWFMVHPNVVTSKRIRITMDWLERTLCL